MNPPRPIDRREDPPQPKKGTKYADCASGNTSNS